MTELAKQLLDRAGDPASITVWETFPVPIGRSIESMRKQIEDFDRSSAKWCGYGNGFLVHLTSADAQELERAGARVEKLRRPPVPPDRW